MRVIRRRVVERLCPQCGVSKPLTPKYWHRNRSMRTGFNSWCKLCTMGGHKKHVGKIRALKEASPCHDCGHLYPFYVMQYDHRPDEEKTGDVSKMMYGSYSWERLVAEIEKCDLVCANCHAKRTWKRANEIRARGQARRSRSCPSQ